MSTDRERSESAGDNLAIQVATAPVNWNNTDLPNFRPFVPFPDVLDEMCAAGYDCTEYDGAFGSDVAKLQFEAGSRSITFAGAYQWMDLENDNAFTDALTALGPRLELLESIDCRHLIVADRLREHRVAIAGNVPVDGSASLGPDGFWRIAANLALLQQTCSAHQIHVHYHNHVGTFVESPGEVAQLISRLPGTEVDLCFDTGHYAFGGGLPQEFICDHLAKIGYLHLKDVDGDVLVDARPHGWSFLDSLRHYVFCPLGQGTVDIPAVIATLRHNTAPMFVVVEQDTCRGDRTVNARNNLRTLSSLLDLPTSDASKE